MTDEIQNKHLNEAVMENKQPVLRERRRLDTDESHFKVRFFALLVNHGFDANVTTVSFIL